ncbi:hypothetical protein CRE_24808 [Caenorhabditis remanei]|uniref:Uncharacterized protein n=1 Tax=Caenorhabditis remanei TaxID=31234 RepID=E3NFR9_CAERE|nr:hypothetical protein CRE_24808 [Caenorhabditis remanei]
MEPVPNNSAFSPNFIFDSPQDWFFDFDCHDEELPSPSSPINYDFWTPQDYSFDQYGAGPSNIANPSPPPRRSVKSTKFPSDEELTYLRRYAQVTEDFNFKRLNLDVVKMPPQRLQFKNLDALPQGVSLDDHMANVFDIFIRKMIQKAGGNLTTTKYWLNLRHPGYRADDGFWIMHQTYAVADGHFLCNTIANHMQSNKNISLDDAMTISMKIFERDKKSMAGRGRNIPKESLGSKVMKKFGVKWGLIAGEGHCLPKALAVGIVWSDYKNEKDPVEKEKLHRRYISLTRMDKSAEGRAKRQLEAAKKLLTDAGMDPNCEEHSLDDFDKLATHLSKYRIRLWSNEGDTSVPKDDKNINTDGDGFIALFFADNHYEFFKPTIEDWGLR